jgi:hypothetical protein
MGATQREEQNGRDCASKQSSSHEPTLRLGSELNLAKQEAEQDETTAKLLPNSDPDFNPSRVLVHGSQLAYGNNRGGILINNRKYLSLSTPKFEV